MRHLKNLIGVAVIAGLLGAGAAVVRSQAQTTREWRYYGGDHAFTRYAPLDQITRDNVKNLKIAWRRPAVNPLLTDAFPDLKVNPYLKSTPIIVDGVIYTQDAHGLCRVLQVDQRLGLEHCGARRKGRVADRCRSSDGLGRGALDP